jgi:hypothetical protein
VSHCGEIGTLNTGLFIVIRDVHLDGDAEGSKIKDLLIWNFHFFTLSYSSL